MNPRLTPLAAALSIAFVAPAQAQTADLDPVIVSATRFNERDTTVAANVSVITRDDIRNTPARDLPSMLKGSAGVDVRALYGGLGIDSTEQMDALQTLLVEKHRVAIMRGDTYGPEGKGYIRLNVGCPRSKVDKGLDALIGALQELLTG